MYFEHQRPLIDHKHQLTLPNSQLMKAAGRCNRLKLRLPGLIYARWTSSTTVRRPIKHRISSIPEVKQELRNGQSEIGDAAAEDDERQLWRHAKRKSPHGPPFKNVALYDDEDVIVPGSLQDTLNAHRQVNRDAPVIRKVYRDKQSRPQDHEVDSQILFKKFYIKRQIDSLPSKRHIVEASPLDLQWALRDDVSRYLKTPWMQSVDSFAPSTQYAEHRLGSEIASFSAYFTPTATETTAAASAHKRIQDWVQKFWPNARLDVIGSRANGLAMPTSDIDLNLTFDSNVKNDNNLQDKTRNLTRLWNKIRFSNVETPLTPLYCTRRARVPLISALDPQTGLEVQIQCAESCYGSLATVKGMLAEYENLGPLFKVLKHMLKIRALTSARYAGGITSYPLLQMIAVVLKLNPGETQARHLGSNLLKVLDFWSNIDFNSQGVTHIPSIYVDPARSNSTSLQDFFADEKIALETIDAVVRDPVGARPVLFDVKHDLQAIHQATDNFMMVLHDPANPDNDLGRSATLIRHIQATMSAISQELKRDMADWDKDIRVNEHASQLGRALLRSPLEADYTIYNVEREKVVSYQSLPSQEIVSATSSILT